MVLLHFFSIAPVHTGAPYSMRGRMTPLCMVLSAMCFSPQLSFADLASVCMSVEHFLDVCMMCSLKFSLLSIMIPRYLMLFTCSKGLLFKYINTSVFSLLPCNHHNFRFLFIEGNFIVFCPVQYFTYLCICEIFSFSYSFCPFCY